MNTDRTVVIVVDLPGQTITLRRERGRGDNPAFYASQIEEVLDGVKRDLRAMIEATHGRQIGA